MNEHMVRKHEISWSLVKCNKCGFKIGKSQNLKSHKMTMHLNMNNWHAMIVNLHPLTEFCIVNCVTGPGFLGHNAPHAHEILCSSVKCKAIVIAQVNQNFQIDVSA